MLLLVGCSPEGAPIALPSADPVGFAAIEPVLGLRCGNPSCHGQDGRPLRVYTPQRFRLDPSRTFVEEPLTALETELNLASAAVFLSPDSPAESPLLSKPLAVSAGGATHSGGAQFEDVFEPEYQALLRWASTAKEGP